MARGAGQIADIIQKLEKGIKSQAYKEVGSRKKEEKHHKKKYREVRDTLAQASHVAKKGAGLGSKLALVGSLFGGGPLLLALLAASGTMIGGKEGVKDAKKYLKDAGLSTKTKFGADITEFKEGLGSDLGATALTNAMITGLTAGTTDAFFGQKGKDLLSGLKKPLGKIGNIAVKSKNIPMIGSVDITLGDIVGEQLKKFGKTGIGKIVKGAGKVANVPGWKFAEKGLLKKIGFGKKGLTTLLSSAKKGAVKETLGKQLLSNVLTGGAIADKLKKQPDPFSYELPEHMSRPIDARFRGYS